MKETPTIFNTENVKAILEGKKTQTRRIMKPQPNKPEGTAHDWEWKPAGMLCYDDYFRSHAPKYCPYGQVGDRLWVRETFAYHTTQGVVYKADFPESPLLWEPSIHMRREDSRITLEITEIRVERLWEITSWDIEREGLPYKVNRQDDAYEIHDSEIAIVWFQGIWDSLNPKYPWESNPFVWVITFKKEELCTVGKIDLETG